MSALRGRLTWIAALTICVGAVIAIALTVLREDPPPALRGAPKAKSAGAFVDSIGVNVHLTYYDTAYERFDEWSALLGDLGVRHVRDGLVTGDPRYTENLRKLGRLGHRATLIVEEQEGTAAESVALAAGPLREAVAALEGPNESDTRRPDWQPALERFMPQLSAAIDDQLGADFPLLAPSFVNGDSRPQVEQVADAWDIENVHPYPGGEAPKIPDQRPGVGERLMATETGYHNAVKATEGQPPVSEEAAAKYLPRLLAESYAAGVERTFLYELIDEMPDPALANAEQHFGLLRQDLSPKPAYDALRRMIDAVSESPGAGRSRDVLVQDGPDDLAGLLLEREDGSRVLLLWRRLSLWDTDAREAIDQSASPTELRFGGQARDIEITYPSREPSRVDRPDSERLEVLVGADIVCVSYR